MTSLEYQISTLRKHLLRIGFIFLIALIIGFFYSQDIVQYLTNAPMAKDIPMNVFAVGESFNVYLKVALLLAIGISLPYTLLEVWLFVSLGLRNSEKKLVLLYVPMSIVLFITGVLFSYFVVFPLTFNFLTGFSDRLGVNEIYGIHQYFSFLFRITFPITLLFQFPVIIMFLSSLGILSPKTIKKYRKYILFSLFVLAAVIAPPDLIIHFIMVVPLIIMFETSLILAGKVYKKERWQ